ncbi:CLUMA_CG009156, isoform A [Clunio marinus]|uniref:CLUMA_CG009156, isoform A n=1 Tax=Clunio marinus TaxID=568069 RepID=A0A1J1I7I0_9DIPT|nr:CLUMA_CG009156, isoform A [Clunio marinus]
MMKFLLKLLLTIAFVHCSNAVLGIHVNGFEKNGKYRLNREPPLDDRKIKLADDELVEIKWIEQKLNNFDPQDHRTWQMRYMENRNFSEPGGPICIYIGGEWTISMRWLLTGHMHDMCRDLKGIMYYTEHRYYGSSWPTEDLSMENLRYLSIDQALADLAHFIIHVKETNPELADSGVFLVGASYSATMATWFMQKYPHLVVGAWSSSAPLLAKVDFIEYKEVVSEAFEIVGGTNCSSRIKRAFEQLERLVEEKNTDRIEEIFSFCYPLDLSKEIDVWSFFSDVAGPFSGVVQYYREESRDIEIQCEVLMENDIEDDLEALAFWFWGGVPSGGQCYNHRYEAFINYYSGTEWTDRAALVSIRQWYYQTCSEYGWDQSSGSENILFGSTFPVELSLQICQDLYSSFFTPEIIHANVDRTNIIYGALNPSVRNVYSTHGEFDPWRPMGVQEDINEYSPTVILPRQSHCSDLYSVSELDTPELLESKQRIFSLLRQWLGMGETEPIPTD